MLALRWRHNDHDGVSNHHPHGCLLNRRSKKTSKLRVTGLCVGNSPGPVNSPHKGPVTRKMFPFDDVIMGTERNHSKSFPVPYVTSIHNILHCVPSTPLLSLAPIHSKLLYMLFMPVLTFSSVLKWPPSAPCEIRLNQMTKVLSLNYGYNQDLSPHTHDPPLETDGRLPWINKRRVKTVDNLTRETRWVMPGGLSRIYIQI